MHIPLLASKTLAQNKTLLASRVKLVFTKWAILPHAVLVRQ